MGTEVLRPQNCLIERIRVPPAAFNQPRRKNLAGNRNPHHNAAAGRRKRPDPANSRRSASFDDQAKGPTAAGHVTILRRGQSIGDLKKVSVSLSSPSSRADVYAGSTVAMSPSPRALPLPSFFSKKAAERGADDSATRDLRRILGLE